MTAEQWKPVPGYEHTYQVSDLGRVRSLPRRDRLERRWRGRLLKCGLNSHGYPRVNLRHDGNADIRLVHRIVAEVFLPPDPGRPYVNHKNGIKHDNRVENLEWCTSAENLQHAHDTGLSCSLRGSASNLSSLNEQQVRVIARGLRLGLPRKYLATSFGVRYPAIKAIASRLTWAHITHDIL